MLKKKGPLTYEEHKAIGAELALAKRMLHSLSMGLESHYPRSARSVKLACRACTAVDSLRCELDDVVAREHPDDFTCREYYGHESPMVDRIEHHSCKSQPEGAA